MDHHQEKDVLMTASRTLAEQITPFLRRRWLKIFGAFVLLIVLLLASPMVLGEYAQQILSQAFFFAIAAITVDLLWGYTGVLTFGQSAFFGIGVYTVAIALTYYVDGALATVGAIFAAMIGAALVGAAVGWLSFWDRATPIYVAIVTLALPVVFTQIILSGGAYTGSSSGLPIPVPFLSITEWYYLAGGLLLLVAIGAYVFVSSDAGRVLVAIRENEERCRYLGLNTSRMKIHLMTACSAIAALSGACYVLFSSVAAHSYGDFVFGTELVVWTALGGRGTLIGPILGTVGVNYVSALLGGNLPFIWLLFVGFAFVLIVVYLPEGLVPAIGEVLSTLVRPIRQLLNGGWNAVAAGAQPGASAGAAVALSSTAEALDQRRSMIRAPDEAPVLELRDVGMQYGSLVALQGVSLKAYRGEVVGIIGPNGAGKTTLLRCIADGRERSTGEVLIDGHRIDRLPPQRCVAFGVSRKFQTPNVFDALTVLDCLRVARSYREPTSPWRRSHTVELPETALNAVEVSGLPTMLNERASHLSHGAKQALELAMVLAQEPTVLLLDEPTAGLTRDERAAIGSVLTELAQSHRLCILLIEHDLDFVREISTRLVVLHMGKVLLDGPLSEIADSDLIRSIYVGGTA
jgi:ABC-type branched-subunit amino acid transport system ATPase component/ABC-type branched-subunit amino acid transport system permease subunit